MTEIYNCLLWEKAKVLAQDRGLEMSPTCPVDKLCKGSECTIIRPTEKLVSDLEQQLLDAESHGEYGRSGEILEQLKLIDRRSAKDKLNNLRKELDTL